MNHSVVIVGDAGRHWFGAESEEFARLIALWRRLWSECSALDRYPLFVDVELASHFEYAEPRVVDGGAGLAGLFSAAVEFTGRGRVVVLDLYSPLSLLILDELLAVAASLDGGVLVNARFPFGLRASLLDAGLVARALETGDLPVTAYDLEPYWLGSANFPQQELTSDELERIARRSRFCGVVLKDDVARLESLFAEGGEKERSRLISRAGYLVDDEALRRVRMGFWFERLGRNGSGAGEEPLVLLGGRIDGHCGAVLDVLYRRRGYRPVAVLDCSEHLYGRLVDGIPVVGSTEDLALVPDGFSLFAAAGDNFGRRELFVRAQELGKRFISLFHPDASISPQATLGEGVFVGVGAVINRGAELGDGVIVNSGAIVEHNCTLEPFVHIAPGAQLAGRVRVREAAFVGIGSSVIPDIVIGCNCMVGAGTPVVADIPDSHTVRGQRPQMYMGRSDNIYLSRLQESAERTFLPVAQPTLPMLEKLTGRIQAIFETRMLSNFGAQCEELEARAARYLGVRHCVATTSGTTGLMMLLRILAGEEGGEVIMPSFTFGATGIAAVWNNLVPVYADIDEHTFNLDPASVEARITPRTKAILGVHIFGNPCRLRELERIAADHDIPLMFDSAHAFGSDWHREKIGCFGIAEVFSLSGTKVLTAGEGGLIATNDDGVAERLRLLRNYGAGADYNIIQWGLNGKISEFHAALAVEALALFDSLVARRLSLVQHYIDMLGEVPGVTFQRIEEHSVSVYKDLAIIVDKTVTGVGRDELARQLADRGIQTKKYFYPPLHQMDAFSRFKRPDEELCVTERVAGRVLCLPLFSHMSEQEVDIVSNAVREILSSEKSR